MQLPYYKLANQKNVLHSLAALFQLELYYFRTLQQTYFPTDTDMPDSPSKLFTIEDWGNSWVVLDMWLKFANQMISDAIYALYDCRILRRRR